MSKVILHNMTLKGIENVPGVLDFDQRGILLAERGDMVITRSKIDKVFLEYLTELGYNFDEVTFLEESSKPSLTFDSIFHDKTIFDAVIKHDAKFLDTYNLTSYENEFANKTGKTLNGNSHIASLYGTKSGFRNLCEKIKLPIAFGFQNLNKPNDVVNKILELKKHTNLCILRLDEGVSGAGNFLINIPEFEKLKKSQQINKIELLLNKIPQINKSSGITVEDWIENVTSSPSLQFEVQRNGEIILLSSHDQILEGVEKWYTGCQYPSSLEPEVYTKVINDGFKFMSALKQLGYSGPCGLDFIITQRSHFIVEANVRKQGTLYPREFLRKIYGSLDNVYYTAQDIVLSNLQKITVSQILEALEDLLIKSKKDTSGVLIYNVGAIKDGNRLDVIATGQSMKIQKELIQETIRILSHIC